MWNTILRGEPAAVYVKNRARDGLQYWVFALVTPLDGGYLSVRIKPSSELGDVAMREYRLLRARERSEDLKPEESARVLLERLSELGYPDFSSFMLASLKAEIHARDSALKRSAVERRVYLSRLATLVDEMRIETEELTRLFKAIRTIPTNMRIAAARLGGSGRPLIAISENYALMCREIWIHIDKIAEADSGGFTGLQHRIGQSHFLSAAARLQEEACRVFDAERMPDSPVDRAVERGILAAEAARYQQKSVASLSGVIAHMANLTRACSDLKRLVSGLDLTRILCRVEGGRLPPGQGAALVGIIEQLDRFHSEVSVRLESIDGRSREVMRLGKALGDAQAGIESRLAFDAARKSAA